MENRIIQHEAEISTISSQIKAYKNFAWGCVWIGILFLVLGVLAFILDVEKMYNLNLIGDYVGGVVGSLWALASIFLIYIAFLGQQMSNIYQQIELLITKEDFQEHRKDVKSQTVTFKKQQFENTFFNLINLIDSHRRNIEMANVKGVMCFSNLVEILESGYKSSSEESEKAKIKSMFSRSPKLVEGLFNSYSRSFKETYNFIGSSNLAKDTSSTYYSILFSQFSENEMLFLFYFFYSADEHNIKAHLKEYLSTGRYFKEDHINL